MRSPQKTLTKILQKNDKAKFFMPPDNGDVKWESGAETFTREEVAYLLWSQIAMMGNDLKTHCGKDLTPAMFEIIEEPRIPEF